ncbi:protein YgfX [Salinisphaera sp. T31B1]|uniref:protein YgfX n=1 Tax=Salinisphaera sp. T31B1 TaxID=727963 RepID=UPI00333FE414
MSGDRGGPRRAVGHAGPPAADSAFVGTLHLERRISLGHRMFVLSTHVLAGVVLLALALARPWAVAAVGLVVVSGVYAYHRACLRHDREIVRLRWPADHHLAWQTADGRWYHGRLTTAYAFGRWLVVLGLRADHARWRRWHCLLFADALSERAHRHLRARLTVYPPPLDDVETG